MNINVSEIEKRYSPEALDAFSLLDRKVEQVFAQVKAWRGWALVSNPYTPRERIMALLVEISRSAAAYQPDARHAGFHMIGRMPAEESKLIQALCRHRAEQVEHGLWAMEERLGASDGVDGPASPATFAVSAVLWRIARVEDPMGYLGVAFLFERLSQLVSQASQGIIENHDLPRAGPRLFIDRPTRDTFLRHLILDVATRHPDSIASMLRCFDYCQAVYPVPVWEEAFERARKTFRTKEKV